MIESAAGVLILSFAFISFAFIAATVAGFGVLLYLARRETASATSGSDRRELAVSLNSGPGVADGVPSSGLPAHPYRHRMPQADGACDGGTPLSRSMA